MVRRGELNHLEYHVLLELIFPCQLVNPGDYPLLVRGMHSKNSKSFVHQVPLQQLKEVPDFLFSVSLHLNIDGTVFQIVQSWC